MMLIKMQKIQRSSQRSTSCALDLDSQFFGRS
jgi:hypothetical protein